MSGNLIVKANFDAGDRLSMFEAVRRANALQTRFVMGSVKDSDVVVHDAGARDLLYPGLPAWLGTLVAHAGRERDLAGGGKIIWTPERLDFVFPVSKALVSSAREQLRLPKSEAFKGVMFWLNHDFVGGMPSFDLTKNRGGQMVWEVNQDLIKFLLLPEGDGWRQMDLVSGIPVGKILTSDNKEARYLRLWDSGNSDFAALAVRRYDGVGRVVYLGGVPSDGFGVLERLAEQVQALAPAAEKLQVVASFASIENALSQVRQAKALAEQQVTGFSEAEALLLALQENLQFQANAQAAGILENFGLQLPQQ